MTTTDAGATQLPMGGCFPAEAHYTHLTAGNPLCQNQPGHNLYKLPRRLRSAAPRRLDLLGRRAGVRAGGGVMIRALLAWLIAPRCPLGCGERVRPAFLIAHYQIDHAGDEA